MTDLEIVDLEGPDLIVFENPFPTWVETGIVAASEDGETWLEWPCEFDDPEGIFPGCAGTLPVLASSSNGIDPTDPEVAGGNAFDLADIGLSTARFIRVTDSGANIDGYGGAPSGFDLDAVAAVHWAIIE